MRVMILGKATPETEAGVMPSLQMWTAMEKFQEELVTAGIAIVGEGLMPSSTGVRVRCSGTDRIVTEGPFEVTRELICGYSIWQVQSMEEAIAWVKRCPMANDSEVEIRPVFTYSEEDVSEIAMQS